MSETLIYIIIFAAIMFFMHRGHGAHGGGTLPTGRQVGGCGGHSHGEHKGQSQNHKDPAADAKIENKYQHRQEI